VTSFELRVLVIERRVGSVFEQVRVVEGEKIRSEKNERSPRRRSSSQCEKSKKTKMMVMDQGGNPTS
jgi:hypothetical protein